MDIRALLGQQQRPDGNALDMLLSALQSSSVVNPPAMDQRDAQMLQDIAGSSAAFPPEPINPQASYSNEGRNYPTPIQAIAPTPIQPLIESIKGGEIDPAFDRVPMDGTANTEGGVERVNAYTNMHGVKAIRDPKTGAVTLTNIGEDGTPTPQSQKQVYGFNPGNSTASTSLNALMEDLRKAPDAETARGIANSMNVALAEETTLMKNEAIKQAERELGVALLKNQLATAEGIDQAKPGYIPGIGDSPGTLAIRRRLAEVQGQVTTKANEWLSRNISYNRLLATKTNAEAEIKRVVDKALAQEQKIELAKVRADEKAEAADEKARVAYSSLSPVQKQVLVRINPSLAKPDMEKEAIAFVERQAKIDKDFIAIMDADPTEFKNLAFTGNKHAAQLLAEEESAKTGQPAAEIESQIKQLSTMQVTPQMAQEWITSRSNSALGDKGQFRKEQMASWNDAMQAKSPEQKAAYQSMQAQIRMHAYKKQQSQAFLGNVLSWTRPDSPLRAAGQKALQTTGKADLSSALRILVDGQEPTATIALLQAAKQEIAAIAEARKGSVFGGVDSITAMREVDDVLSNNEGFVSTLRNILATGAATVANPGLSAVAGMNGFKF